MMGTAVDLGRRQGDSRFYDAAKARRGHHHGLPKSRCAAAAVAQEKAPEEPSPVPVGVAGNLERFVAAVTLSVPAEFPSKRAEWRDCRVDGEREKPYFLLGDLWEAYKEWSAYGAGVPLVLDGCDGVVQYYVPYLSAIELCGDPSVLNRSSNPSWPSLLKQHKVVEEQLHLAATMCTTQVLKEQLQHVVPDIALEAEIGLICQQEFYYRAQDLVQDLR